MSAPTFEPARLRLARELQGHTQAAVADLLEITPAALSQFESGSTRPSVDTQLRLAELLEVPREFFGLPLVDTHEGFFRSPRRTSVSDRRRARAIAHVAHDLATHTANRFVPAPAIPRILLGLDDGRVDAERAADAVRAAWSVPAGPVRDVVGLLENHGIVVIRLPLGSADVDAFSLPFPDRPVVVLGSDKNDRGRSRFDAAHELGHLVMHADQVWGIKSVEDQAHAFAAAFLMPERDIIDELPSHADWPALFQLKRKWQVSVAALLMRARKLERMQEKHYAAAMKMMSARGWRRSEPHPLGPPEQPRLLRTVAECPELTRLKASLPTHVIAELEKASS